MARPPCAPNLCLNTPMTQATSWKKSPWTRAAVTLAGVLALAWLLRGVDTQAMRTALVEVPAWVWLLSVAGMVCSHVLRGGRMRAEWRERLHMDWRSAWALVVRHSAWVVLAPMRGGEGVYLWALHQHGGIAVKDAGISLLKLRLQDMAVLAVFALALWLPVDWPLRLAAAALALALAVWGLPMVWQWLAHRLSTRGDAPATTLQLTRPSFESWAYALSNWAVKLVAIALPLWHLAGASFVAAWSGALGGEWAAAMPLQPPAGLGPYEAGVLVGVQWMSELPWAEVAAAALTVHILMLLVTVTSATVARALGWSTRDLRRPH